MMWLKSVKVHRQEGVDVVSSMLDKPPGSAAYSVGYGGRLVICGNTTGFEAITDLRFLFNKQLSLLGSHQGNKAELLEGLKFVRQGLIKPVVWDTFPLKEAAQAQDIMYLGKHFGNVVLIP
jgi:NADPH:quinone reductase-like Zn-dependent oxidoreductase